MKFRCSYAVRIEKDYKIYVKKCKINYRYCSIKIGHDMIRWFI